jgi:Flp pilus assembly protein TadG
MTRLFSRLHRDIRGGTAAEFAMVLPVLILFLLGTVEVGRIMWTWNKAEKATQMGVRFAVVTAPVPSGLAGYSFTGVGGLKAGDTVPASAYGTMACGTTTSVSSVSCTCTTGTCPWGTAVSTAAFQKIYDRMKMISPDLLPKNVKITYSPSGLGFAGDPSGPNIYPVVTVSLSNVTFAPVYKRLFGSSVSLPDFRSSLTMEDGEGVASN